MRFLNESYRIWITLAVAILLAVVGLALAWALSDTFREWLTVSKVGTESSGTTHSSESGSTTLRNVGLLVAGVVTVGLLIWRGYSANRQASAAQEQTDIEHRQAETAQQGLRNERYQKAAEMLGSEVLPARLGGIYALQRLASEYPEEHHIQIMKLLCAFACDPTKDKDYEEKLYNHNLDTSKFPRPRKDVQAVMDFIASRGETQTRLEKSQDFNVDLMGADLSYVQIIDADLSGAMLNGANLFRANISSVDLSGAYLTDTFMEKATLWDIDFLGASAWRINLSGAIVYQHHEPLFHLDHANLSVAQLYEVDLSGKHIQHSNLAGVQIHDSNLSESSTLFFESDMPGAHIIRSNLSGARMIKTDISGATFRDTELSGTYFYDPDGGDAKSPVTGLTQKQLDQAWAAPGNPPKWDDIVDADTGKQLEWRE